MPYPTEPQKELSSTYIVQDRSNQEEMDRLEVQGKMLTTGMGGALPELADHSRLRRVLDVGCGTGEWLIEAARIYPAIEKLVGVDISATMMEYARAQALALALDNRVRFQTMDALRILEFADASFDLVNQRLGYSWARTWEWTKLLLEYQRVCEPGGLIRITEGNVYAECNSPALTNLNSIALKAFYRSGRLFTASNDGVTRELVRLMTQHGIQNVQTRVHTLVYQAGTEAGESFYKDMLHAFRVLLPFFQKWANVPKDYQEIYQQALKEIQQPDFVVTWNMPTVWGRESG